MAMEPATRVIAHLHHADIPQIVPDAKYRSMTLPASALDAGTRHTMLHIPKCGQILANTMPTHTIVEVDENQPHMNPIRKWITKWPNGTLRCKRFVMDLRNKKSLGTSKVARTRSAIGSRVQDMTHYMKGIRYEKIARLQRVSQSHKQPEALANFVTSLLSKFIKR